MKKTLFAISAIAVLLGFTACTNDEIVEPQVSGKTITIKASTESGATRTALSQNGAAYDVVWSEGDAFKIGENTFTLEEGVGTTSGKFTGTATFADATEYNAYYPTTYDGTNWPTAQTYTAGNITGSPMKATFTYTEGVEPSLSFENVGGILRLTARGEATVKSITVNATELTTPITLDCGSGVALTSEGTQFHIAMPANTYTGVSIKLTDTDDKVCTKTFKGTSGLKIECSKIATASFTASNFAYLPITASSPAGFIGTLNGRTGIVVNLGGSIGTVVIATMNVGATSVDEGNSCYGKYIYFKDLSNTSVTGLSNGWYVPSQDELQALANLTNKTWNGTRKGYEWSFTETGTTLFLPAAGYEYPGIGVFTAGAHGVYSSTGGYGDNTAYPLSFEDSGTCEISNSYQYGYSLRPFHAMPTE